MAVRQFVDASGVTWEVFEVRRHTERRDTVSPGLENGWLTFVAGAEKRRLPTYPEAWWSLADAELLTLSLSARPAPARKSPLPLAGDTAVRVASPSAEPRTLDEERIRAHARTARAAGTPAVQAMIQLKRLLGHHGIDSTSPEFKRVRRLFVETFYFG